MSDFGELLVQRDDLRQTRVVRGRIPEPDEGEVVLAVDRFALTANNVTYAVAGDAIGYWRFFADSGADAEGLGRVPVWGFADVSASRHPEVPEGERIYGFLPMATHVRLRPGRVRPEHFADVSAQRAALPAVYNDYRRTGAEPAPLPTLEDERALLFPLFVTSFALQDWLRDHAFFGAEQVLIGSASSKTGFGLAHLLHQDPEVSVRVVGLTSPERRAWLEGLDACDEVLSYDALERLDGDRPAVFVDMSGDGSLREALHRAFGDRLKADCTVGATHWEAPPAPRDLPGPAPELFFAPAQIGKRESEWGRGVFMTRANEAAMTLAEALKAGMRIETVEGLEALRLTWLKMLDGKIEPSRGLMVAPAAGS